MNFFSKHCGNFICVISWQQLPLPHGPTAPCHRPLLPIVVPIYCACVAHCALFEVGLGVVGQSRVGGGVAYNKCHLPAALFCLCALPLGCIRRFRLIWQLYDTRPQRIFTPKQISEWSGTPRSPPPQPPPPPLPLPISLDYNNSH